ncbi:MAG TPA: N-acetyltransferase [Sphingomonas sp.]|nr:N-acetyltransferase [Sphingomonas sp.]
MEAVSAGVHGERLAPIEEARIEEVEHLLDLAFGPDRHGRTAYRLREGVAWEPAMSCAAFAENGMLAGSLQSWPLALTDADGRVTPLWLVGPIAVHPTRRNEGIGRAMLRRALAAIDRTPWPAVLIGDPEYYAPFGFSAEATGGWELPGPFERHRLLARLDEGETLPASGMLGPRVHRAHG